MLESWWRGDMWLFWIAVAVLVVLLVVSGFFRLRAFSRKRRMEVGAYRHTQFPDVAQDEMRNGYEEDLPPEERERPRRPPTDLAP